MSSYLLGSPRNLHSACSGNGTLPYIFHDVAAHEIGTFETLSITDQNLQSHVPHNPSIFLLLVTLPQKQSFQSEPRRDRVFSQTQDQSSCTSCREPKNLEGTDRVSNQHLLTILNSGSNQNIPGDK